MEYANWEIKRYLRKYISHHQDNWTKFLTILEYMYNTKKADRKIFISFQIIYKETSAITAKKEMGKIHQEELKDDELEKNKNGHPVPEYKQNDWIYLKRRKKRKDRSSRSLNYRWWRSFKIKRRTDLQDVELILSQKTKIHSIVNVCNIKQYHGSSPTIIEQSDLESDMKEYKVETITDEKDERKIFRVKWKKFYRQTWESKENLTNCQDIINEWKKRKSHTSPLRID